MCVAQAAVAIERGPGATTAGGAGARRRWRVQLGGGEDLEADWLVLALGLTTTRLLAPQGQPAPVLMEPEPGLLIATGHYRNGVLLAPASAAWLAERIRGRPHPTSAPAAESSL